MKRWSFLLVLLLFASPGGTESIPVSEFGGIDTDNDPLFLIGKANDSQNVNTDEAQGISPRLGFTRFSTEPSKGLGVFSHSNGVNYIITQSSNVLKANTGDGEFVIVIATVDPNVPTATSQLGDKLFFVNINDPLKYWDTNIVVSVSTPINFSQLVTHKVRLWGAGNPKNERIIYGSKQDDGTQWNLVVTPAETDPVQIPVSGRLDEVITTLYSSFRKVLIWAKANSFGRVTGFKRSNFAQEAISDVVGTAFPETMHDADGELRWLGSSRAIWGYDGANLRDLTRYPEGGGIRELMETVSQGVATSRSWKQTSQSDWNQGIRGVRISTDVSAGDVVFVSTSFTETFEDGDCNSTGGPGGTIPCAPRWTMIDGNLAVTGARLKGPGGAAHIDSTISVATWTFTGFFSVDQLRDIENRIYFMGLATRSVDESFGYSLVAFSSSQNVGQTFQIRDELDVVIISSQMNASIPINTLGVSRTETGQFTLYVNSQAVGNAVDTTLSSSAFIVFHADTDGAIEVGRFQTDENILFSTFTSQEFNVGNKITSWGTFSVNDSLDGGAIKHVLFASDNAGIDIFDPTTFASSEALITNTIPSISTAQYVLVSSSYTRTFRTQNPRLFDFTIRWNDGENIRASSIYTNRKSWFSVSISSTGNNTILVFDRRRQWQVYKGINADTMVTFNANPMFGNDSGIFQAEIGHDDDGNSIDAFYVNKTYYPSKIPFYSTFKMLFMATTNSESTLTTTYQMDGVETDISLASRDMSFVDGYQNFKLPFTNLKKGRTISIKWAVNSTKNWRILEGQLRFEPEKIIRAN